MALTKLLQKSAKGPRLAISKGGWELLEAVGDLFFSSWLEMRLE